MKKTVMMIMGSHRKHKNTAFFSERLKAAFLKSGFEVAYFDVNDLKIEHCSDCGYCSAHYAKCVFNDDMNSIYEVFRTHKHVIFLSPVYMNNITSKFKVLVDRCQMIFMCDFKHKRPFVSDFEAVTRTGIIVSIGGARAYENQFRGSEFTLSLILKNLRIPLKRHIELSGTDQMGLKDRVEEVDTAINQIVNEVITNEAKI